MSIRDDMVQKVLGNPGKYSIQQLQAAMKSGSLPAYVVVPIIKDKVEQQKQMQAAMAIQQQPPVKQMPPIAAQVMQEAQGVAQLPTNLPQEYAAGGIVAFEEGGEVERFQAGGRSQYEEYIRRRASELGVDPDLAMRMFATESSFNPQAVSPKGAVGLGQLMPATAKELGLAPEERTDPMKNIDASLRYFKQQQERFGGDPQKAAAAYNMGPTALTRLLERTGGVLDRGGLNPETAKYLTNLFPVSSAIAEETPRRAVAPVAPQGIAQLPSVSPQLAGEQPISDIGYGDVVRGGMEVPSEESTTPIGRAFTTFGKKIKEGQENAKLQQAVFSKYGPKASVFGLAMSQSDDERQAAKSLTKDLRSMTDDELRAALEAPNAIKALERVQTARIAKEQRLVGPDPETAGMATAVPGSPKETQVAAAPTQQPGDVVPAPVDLMSMVADAPAQIKAALGEMRDKRKAELDKMVEPSIALLEKRSAERGKRLEAGKEDAAMNAALAFLSGVAGTRGHWADALSKGGKDLLNSLVTSQAAQQAAQDKYDQAADALELKKLELNRNNVDKADAYAEKYASLMMQGTKLQVDGAYHFNKNLIDSFDADTKRKTLAAGTRRLEVEMAKAQAGDTRARAQLMAAGNKMIQAWDASPERRAAEAAITEKYGKDWMKLPLQSQKRLQAEAELQQAKNVWVTNNMALHAGMGTFGSEGSSGVRDVNDLLAGNI